MPTPLGVQPPPLDEPALVDVLPPSLELDDPPDVEPLDADPSSEEDSALPLEVLPPPVSVVPGVVGSVVVSSPVALAVTAIVLPEAVSSGAPDESAGGGPVMPGSIVEATVVIEGAPVLPVVDGSSNAFAGSAPEEQPPASDIATPHASGTRITNASIRVHGRPLETVCVVRRPASAVSWYASRENVLLVGTSGYSYPKWKGAFYPADLPHDRMLEYYASRFTAVEINNTFYRMPKASVLEGWAASVPEHFRFVLKASRRITHQNRLVGSEDNLAYLYTQARALGDRLGGVLYQLPPTLRKDPARLQGFVRALPPDARAILEFRHASWLDEEIFAILRDAGVVLCMADAAADLPETPALDLAGQGYVRLRRPAYTDAELTAWRARIQATWSDAYVVFMHEDDGEAPVLAERFVALGAPESSPPADPSTID